MIKLNNKNITYVALADSNNSLKAPKEIWYADSCNSVKLVYRRKDTLIEGVDYEKYHWLDGDGSAYIDTLVSDLTNVDTVTCHFYWYEDVSSNNRIFGRESPKSFACAVNFSVSKLSIWIESPYIQLNLNNGEDYFEVDLVNQKISTSLQTRWISPITEIIGTSFYLFGDNGYNKIFSGKIKSFVIGDKLNLIPCKLLKPVPKWLDANGIRRQVGECGMIDLVSGKFYGNVNSVGTFTVENYYERKEWLVGDGSAYINTKVTSYTGIISTKYNFIESEIINNESAILGRERVDYTIADFSSRLVFLLRKSFGNLELHGTDATVTRIQYLTTDTIDVDVVNNTFTTSTQSGSVNIGDNVVGRDLYLFASNSGSSAFRLFNGKIAYLRIPDKLNLIPCTLTMDLPASMDANGIARTKGTSGMWDLVSDRFYGNVANSGTFKAVNLAEGVDYEVHQWLVGEISSIGTLQRLPINSSSMSYKVKRISGVNFHFFMTEGYYVYYYRTETVHLGIYDLNQKTLIYNNFSITDNELDFECSAGNVYVNGVDIPIYGFPIKEVRFHAADNGGMKISTSSITVDGIERYIPVKLLRSIPSKYDANGIARQAGECGMYDTVNDVFYGNVASSGSFTVSDDN